MTRSIGISNLAVSVHTEVQATTCARGEIIRDYQSSRHGFHAPLILLPAVIDEKLMGTFIKASFKPLELTSRKSLAASLNEVSRWPGQSHEMVE